MELLQLEHFGKTLRLEGSLAGWQQLYWGEHLVSQLTATENQQSQSEHVFELTSKSDQAMESDDNIAQTENIIKCQLVTELRWQPFIIKYELFIDGISVAQGSRNSKDIEKQKPIKAIKEEKKLSMVGIASLGFKLLKSAKILKVVLARASLAAYRRLFSYQFVLSLLACLVVHV